TISRIPRIRRKFSTTTAATGSGPERGHGMRRRAPAADRGRDWHPQREGSRMAAPKAFSHVVLKTFQLDAMRDWYLAVLDAHVVHETPGKAVFLTYDEEHHRVAITQLDGEAPAAVPRPMAGLLHLAYTHADIRV